MQNRNLQFFDYHSKCEKPVPNYDLSGINLGELYDLPELPLQVHPISVFGTKCY